MNGLSAILFNSKSLGLLISSVSFGSLSFLMCHCSTSGLRNFVDFNLGNWLSVAVLHPISFPSFLFKNDYFIGFKMIYIGSFNLGTFYKSLADTYISFTVFIKQYIFQGDFLIFC